MKLDKIAKFLGAAVGLLALTIVVPIAQAAPINLFNTGVDNSGTPLPDGTIGDPHYILLPVPGSTTDIRVRTEAGGFPISSLYIGNDAFSAWIGPNNASDLAGPDAPYIYRTTFDLTGFNPSTTKIIGQWSSDNQGGDIVINGATTGQSNNNIEAFRDWVPFSILTGFIAGMNTLDFVVANAPCPDCKNGDNPTALRVEMSGTADLATVPLPAALPLFAGGLGVIGLLARRRKRKQMAACAA